MEKEEKIIVALLVIMCFLMGFISGFEMKTAMSDFSCANWCNQKIRDSATLYPSNIPLSQEQVLGNINLSTAI